MQLVNRPLAILALILLAAFGSSTRAMAKAVPQEPSRLARGQIDSAQH
jgi:hypothetical protein